MFLERLTEQEFKDIIEKLIKKYDLRKSSREKIFEVENLNASYIVNISKYEEYYGPTTVVRNYCVVSDFEFSSNLLFDEEEENALRDFRKIMYSIFGDEYRKALKKFLRSSTKSQIKELKNELNAKNKTSMEDLEN